MAFPAILAMINERLGCGSDRPFGGTRFRVFGYAIFA
jgi:hypothetical protein